MDPILEQFLSEARENLSFLDKNLDKLSSGDAEMLNALFRAAHTLKGGAGLVGLQGIKKITHYAEDLLDGIKKGHISFSDDMLDVLYDAFDEVVELIDATEELGEPAYYDEIRIEQIAKSVQALIGKNDEVVEDDSLNTDLNIITNRSVCVGHLIEDSAIFKFIKELPFSDLEVNNQFLEDENFYLIDIDLDEECCEVGNDPAYLLYLLGEENLYNVSTHVNGNCQEIKDEPTKWKTRFLVVAKSTKDTLEDSLYNVMDDVAIYPLNVKTLLCSSYPSNKDEIFDDFALEFQEIMKSGHYEQLSEKISAVCKVLNLESKEGFLLNRLQNVLAYFEFEGVDYLELVKFSSSILGLNKIEQSTVKKSEILISKPLAQDTKPVESYQVPSTLEEQSMLNILKQQLKVLQYSKDDSALSRVKLFTTRAMSFIGESIHFSISDDVDSVKETIQSVLDRYAPKQVKIDDNIEPTSDVVEENVCEEKNAPLETKIEELVVEDDEIVAEEDFKNIIQTERNATNSTSSAIPKTVKIDQSEIDGMMDLIGELLVMKNALPYVANNITSANADQSKTELMAKYEEINRVTDQLQDKVMGMRLLPMSYIFGRYPKLVRDISKQLNKKIRFEESGGDTKLDKTMIEKIADPLVHIIRNSLDHGIEESSDERIKAGKPSEGFIKISAKSAGDRVEIVVEDDGRGIDTEKVLVKALGLGITTEKEIEAMSDNDKLMMIFNPGLSTKDVISDLSGRGVGTDAVKKTIDELNGKIYLESTKGKGTKLTIDLPVSVALTNVFHIKMDNINYAIDMQNIIETIKIRKHEIQTANNKQYVRLRGEIIPLIFEPRLLPQNQQNEEVQSIVIVQGKTLRYGLVVNNFVNQLNVVQKPLDGILNQHPMITGTSLLGNGEILFIIDPNKIVQ
jgi:two-component system chemotaxis sensor kinase CheA